MHRVIRLLLLLSIVSAICAIPGCARARLHEAKEENMSLKQENESLKQQLADTKAELNRTKIALDRAQADLATTRSSH